MHKYLKDITETNLWPAFSMEKNILLCLMHQLCLRIMPCILTQNGVYSCKHILALEYSVSSCVGN